MSNYKIKGLPQIKLLDLLKKKRSNLKDFLNNLGIASYQTLLQKCQKMGVAPPSEKEFEKATEGKVHSSPQEGVVVLESQKLIKENTGEKVEVDFFPKFSDVIETEESVQESALTVEEEPAKETSSYKKKKKN